MFAFKPKLFLVLIFNFMIMTVVGTLTHELGHYTAARLLGYHASINYRSTDTDFSPIYDQITAIRKNTPDVIQRAKNDPQRLLFFALNNKLGYDSFLISISGPLQTMLTGSFGLICLFLYQKRLLNSEQISIKAWALIFLALFWLRQTANAFMYLVTIFVNPASAINSDEHHIAFFLDWPSWSIILPSALVGSAVLGYVIYILPKTIRFTFITAGCVGGVFGFAGWFFWLGRVLMP